MSDIRHTCPELMKIVDLIAAGNALQRKRIEVLIDEQDADYRAYAEDLSRTLNGSFLRSDAARREAAEAYNRMCMDILREEIRFRKTGVYLRNDALQANQAVYSQHQVMRYYVVGLLLSYLFWPNHYRILRFFREQIHTTARRCLEVGAGHGLFTAEVLGRCPRAAVTLVDISPTSIDIARELLDSCGSDRERVRFIEGDYLSTPLSDEPYDLIVLGEVLEHVNDAVGFLRRAREVLKPGGQVFLSTCANCPAVDHIYHFHTVCEIRETIRTGGLTIVSQLALPARPVPEDQWQEELVTINYCAMLTAG
jgi:2-polyprenyl-3-methyl-5-hydroxy-6-metoxy-1,4-benzoquinol methylase